MIRMKSIFLLVIVICILIGCNSYSETFVIEGKITEINKDRSFVYVDHAPIKVKKTDQFKIGQKIRITLNDRTADDDWDPEDFSIKKIEYLD